MFQSKNKVVYLLSIVSSLHHHHRAFLTSFPTRQQFSPTAMSQTLYDSKINRDKFIRNNDKNVRLESQQDPSLSTITNKDQVFDKIKEVREIQNLVQTATLYKRSWIHTNGNNIRETKNKSSDDTNSHNFTVLQFNTLAEGLASSPQAHPPFQSKDDSNDINDSQDTGYGGFTEVPNPNICLDFNLRRWRLVEVILGGGIFMDNQFDIIGLEEVDRYYGFFQPIMTLFEYDSLFYPKPNSPGSKNGWFSDGCALFWKRDVFDLIQNETRKYQVGSQIYIVVVLRHKQSGRDIIVAVTHLKAKQNDDNEQIRTQQVIEVVNYLSDIRRKVATENDLSVDDIPVILMGDFNADPDGDGRTCIKSVLSQELQLNSAYNLETDFFTTWKTRGDKTVRRIIDYIFHTNAKGFECSKTLSIPDNEEIESSKLPGFRFPSDHMSIGAEFVIRKPK